MSWGISTGVFIAQFGEVGGWEGPQAANLRLSKQLSVLLNLG